MRQKMHIRDSYIAKAAKMSDRILEAAKAITDAEQAEVEARMKAEWWDD